MDAAARKCGVDIISIDRPGIGRSDAWNMSSIAQWPHTVAQGADLLQVAKFAVAGWSGGGPYALASAAAMPERVRAVATVAGMAPLETARHVFELGLWADRLLIPTARSRSSMTWRHKVDREFVFAAVADERRQIASLIDSLDDAQLASPSLCRGWDVKTVAAHLVSVVADSSWAFQRTALRRGGVHRAIDELARRRVELPAAEIAATLRLNADHELSPPITGPRSGLADVLVHGGDIRIPLGLPFAPDHQRVGLALDFLTGPLPLGFVPRRRLRGISLYAMDIDRTWGTGAEVRGRVADLMMAACGRVQTLDTLDGPGSALLRHRLMG
jgi:uncharacterized protein (TIGR03083 family)